MIEGKETEDFKNVWEPSEDQNAFYKKIREVMSQHSFNVILPNAEEVKKDNYILFPHPAKDSYELMFSNKQAKSLQGLNATSDDELDKLVNTFPKLLKEHQFSKEQYKIASLSRQTGEQIMTADIFVGLSCGFSEKMSDLSYEITSVLKDLKIKYEGPYVCPITRKEYMGKPYYLDHLKDIDDFIREVHFKLKSLYMRSFFYKDENEYSCIPISELLQAEKEYCKRWEKIKKTKPSNNTTRSKVKGCCWMIRRLLKLYKYYFHLKYLRELFIRNLGNNITNCIT